MPFLRLPEPDWENLVGGSAEAVWIADRDRKASIALEVAERYRDVCTTLSAHGATYRCSPEALAAVPFSADWFVSLAGFSLKTLGNIKEGPANYGLLRSAGGLVESLRPREGPQRARAPKFDDLRAFSDWINAEIDHVHPPARRSVEEALDFVLVILGGRVVGQGQNVGGDDAVVLVKGLLMTAFQARGLMPEVWLENGWVAAEPHHLPLQQAFLRFGGRIECDFTPGGNRADIVIKVDGHLVAVGEIKGRKDTSNVWESWMPQVVDHMKTWSVEFPDAARLFFGTLISEEMIRGVSVRGTERTGLRDLYAGGQLNGVYNVSKLVAHDLHAEQSLRELLDALGHFVE